MSEPILCACGCGKAVPRARYPSQQRRYLNTHQHRGAHNGNYRGGKEQRACPVCLEPFDEFPSQVKVKCGKDSCYRSWQALTTRGRGQKKALVSCAHCARQLRRYPSQTKERNYCNRFCRGKDNAIILAAEKNGRWEGGKWKYIQEQVRLRDNYRCVICGWDLFTDVHHVTSRRKGGTDEFCNLLTLCPNHH